MSVQNHNAIFQQLNTLTTPFLNIQIDINLRQLKIQTVHKYIQIYIFMYIRTNWEDSPSASENMHKRSQNQIQSRNSFKKAS